MAGTPVSCPYVLGNPAEDVSGRLATIHPTTTEQHLVKAGSLESGVVCPWWI